MKVLIADDDPVTLDALKAILAAEGFHALPAKDGAWALRVWEQDRPDLLCLDIMMPKVDGYEVCRCVRKESADVPILFLSAKNEEVDVVLGLELGADDFIRKPFGKHEFLARIRAVLRRSRRRRKSPRVFQMQRWSIYPTELRATTAGGVEIDLSPREVALLEVLWERKGEAVSRDLLFERCWGMDYYPESRTLDQHIVKLRRNLEEDPSVPCLIETVRGVGYRFRG